jgi:ATP-dependent Clp protease ATP-binding subunit ClpC
MAVHHYAYAMFERFTDRARRVLVLAQEEARLQNHSYIGTEHILLGLIHEQEGVAAHAIRRCGITVENARRAVEETVGAGAELPGGSPPFTPRAKKVLELALREALQLGHSYIGTEHILLGLIREGDGVAVTIIQSLGADLGQLHQEVIALMSGNSGDLGEEGEGRRLAGLAGPPRCPRCRAGLSEEARYKVVEVPAEDSESDEGVVSVTLIYCGRCGTALGTA